MPKYLTQKEAFSKCRSEGSIIPLKGVDIGRIRSTLEIAEADVNSADMLIEKLGKNDRGWNSIYKLYYDALNELAGCFLRFEKVKTSNHQCLFAYLCVMHPELELSWEFFERVRTKRNGINYYGSPVGFEDWKEDNLGFNLYIKKLREEIEKKLSEKGSFLPA